MKKKKENNKKKHGAGLVRKKKGENGNEATHGQNHLLKELQKHIKKKNYYRIFCINFC